MSLARELCCSPTPPALTERTKHPAMETRSSARGSPRICCLPHRHTSSMALTAPCNALPARAMARASTLTRPALILQANAACWLMRMQASARPPVHRMPAAPLARPSASISSAHGSSYQDWLARGYRYCNKLLMAPIQWHVLLVPSVRPNLSGRQMRNVQDHVLRGGCVPTWLLLIRSHARKAIIALLRALCHGRAIAAHGQTSQGSTNRLNASRAPWVMPARPAAQSQPRAPLARLERRKAWLHVRRVQLASTKAPQGKQSA